MAGTKLKINVKAGKDFMYFFDETGVYNRVENELGWGLPNTRISDVLTAEFKVYLPKSETFASVNVFPSLPNTKCVGYEIIPSDIGLTSFVPGVYKFEYLITTTTGVVLTASMWFFYYQPLECCISNKKLKTSLGDVESPLVKEVLDLELLLEDSIWASCNGQLIKSQEISDLIWTKCNCCC
jgi:hypothetical protein